MSQAAALNKQKCPAASFFQDSGRTIVARYRALDSWLCEPALSRGLPFILVYRKTAKIGMSFHAQIRWFLSNFKGIARLRCTYDSILNF